MIFPPRIASASLRNHGVARSRGLVSLLGVALVLFWSGTSRGGFLVNFAASWGGYQECTMDGADFDQDIDIDGADFLQWQRGYGKVGQYLGTLGDANKNAFVNVSDLTVWRSQFGGNLMGIPDSTCFKLYFDPEGITSGSVTLVLSVPFLGTTRFDVGADTGVVDVHPQYTASATTPVILPPAAGRQQLETTITFQATNPLNPPAGPVTIFGYQVKDLFPGVSVNGFLGSFEFRPGNSITTFDPATSTSTPFNDTQLIDVPPFSILPPLVLDVDLAAGTVGMRNQSNAPISLKYYEITSLGGGLNPAGWMSIDDTEMDPPGVGWDEAGGSNARALSETNLSGSLVLNPGVTRELGLAYNAATKLRDIVFLYGTPEGSLRPGKINYITGAPASGVPEPGCLGLAVAALAGLASHRRRAE